MNGSLDRRRFLAWGGAALTGLVLAACAGQRAAGPKVDIGSLPDLFADRAGMERIGKHAVKMHGIGNRPSSVAAALAPNGSAQWVGSASAPAIRDHLRGRIADDFEHDRIIDVAGWQLPVTEARVAALVYLSG